MAVPQIVPQSAPPADTRALLRPLADLLKQLYAENPDYGLPFCRALDRAIRYVEEGIAYEPYTATHYRIQSHSCPWLWHYVTLHACPCKRTTPWCWHRALLHLLTAQAALTALDRCPRPTLMHAQPRKAYDMDAILRDCDEIC